jgi:hypothetical protein
MVGVSDVDSNSAYSTSSSGNNEDEDDWHNSKKVSKNLSGLSCFARRLMRHGTQLQLQEEPEG